MRGEELAQSRLTEDAVLVVRGLRACGYSLRRIAAWLVTRDVYISDSAVQAVVCGRTWHHVPSPVDVCISCARDMELDHTGRCARCFGQPAGRSLKTKRDYAKRGRGPRLSPEAQDRILALVRGGMQQQAVARVMRISPSSVCRLLRRRAS